MALVPRTPGARRLLARHDAFFMGLTKKDRIALMHDKDPDGICSGVIVATLVRRLRGKPVDVRLHVPGSAYLPTPGMAGRLKKKRINVLITTDISADHEPAFIRRVAKFARVIILDHHKVYTKFSEKNITVVKPQLLQKRVQPSAYAASKFTFDLGNRLADLSDLDWLAATGLIADVGGASWKRWLGAVFRKHGLAMKKDHFATRLGQMATVINSAIVFDSRNIPLVYKTVLGARKPADVMRSRLRRYHDAVQRELDKWTRLLDKKAEKHPEHELIVYYIEPKLHIKATLSTVLSLKYPHNTLVLLSPAGSMVTVSARRHDQKVAMNTLLERSVQGLRGASGGGHIPAAGARFFKKDLLRFRSQLLDCVARLPKTS